MKHDNNKMQEKKQSKIGKNKWIDNWFIFISY